MKRKYYEPIFTKVKIDLLEDVLKTSAEDSMGSLEGDSDDFGDFFGGGEGEDPMKDFNW